MPSLSSPKNESLGYASQLFKVKTASTRQSQLLFLYTILLLHQTIDIKNIYKSFTKEGMKQQSSVMLSAPLQSISISTAKNIKTTCVGLCFMNKQSKYLCPAYSRSSQGLNPGPVVIECRVQTYWFFWAPLTNLLAGLLAGSSRFPPSTHYCQYPSIVSVAYPDSGGCHLPSLPLISVRHPEASSFMS